tara:strand:+ start:657 stop:1247 length:591 start_codon:yes stop_codon:yes gene_type:complete
MFLKKIFNITFLFFYIYVFSSFSIKSAEAEQIQKVSNYFKNLNEFSSTFVQIQNNEVSEGLIFIKNDRLRIEYTSPSKIVFVLKHNKAMYFNKDLEEVEYFNPKNTIGKFIVDLFNDESFLLNSRITKKEGHIYIQKNILIEEENYQAKIYFEEAPFRLRKLEIINNSEIITFTILNPNFNPNLNNKIFSLANPLL